MHQTQWDRTVLIRYMKKQTLIINDPDWFIADPDRVIDVPDLEIIAWTEPESHCLWHWFCWGRPVKLAETSELQISKTYTFSPAELSSERGCFCQTFRLAASSETWEKSSFPKSLTKPQGETLGKNNLFQWQKTQLYWNIQAREEKRKFSPTANSLRRRCQRSRTWATAQRAFAEERKWWPKVHQARRDDRFSSQFLCLLLTAAIVPTRPTPRLLCSPLHFFRTGTLVCCKFYGNWVVGLFGGLREELQSHAERKIL